MNLGAFFESEFDEHLRVAADARKMLSAPFSELTERCVAAIRNGGKLLFFGNGGSAADAQHLATEFTIRYVKDRPAIAAIALTTDSSALTAAGNDLGFDQLFARQIEALGKPEDVAIGISTSGTSPNVIEGLKAARRLGLVAAGFAGRGGGDMVGLADPLIVVPHDASNRIQEMHITIGHSLCGAIEIELGLAEAK
ncbi:SIS domain-containing protein [Nisaea acidiphila]|uniref:Phosphoheptose isomerase n=1 Tax=Nisaea acidiphila TaxID=1862145 RepID=A0A9J7AY92_9PROT|nr:SIS domain-containing protein [Nisaea acidiphila]UUX52038.1 SIS domain-containing protein [Nisaea acidiphila]